MLRFMHEWDYYPHAFPDLQTTNESFLRLAKVYADMGVKNNLFHLALFQPLLQGVDPFDPNLTPDQMAMIAQECRENPWYYLREVCRVPQEGTPVPSKFLANRANIAMVWAFLCNVDFALIMPRQTGKSVGADCLNTWLINIAAVNTKIQLLTKDHNLRVANIKRLKALRKELPAYLNFQTSSDADNTEIITCDKLSNRYLTAVAQKDKDAALNVGRGLTSPILQSDEGPFCPNIHISLPVALASTGTARDIAEANGTFYGNLFTTTAGKRDSEEGKFMYNLIHNGMYMNEMIYDCKDKTDLRETILRNCTGKRVIINGTFSHLQVGKTNAWLRDKIINGNDSPDGIRRDFLNIWTSGSETSPLSNQLNDKIREAVRAPDYVQASTFGHMLQWYIPMDQLHRRMTEAHTIITLDSSNAVGSDANGLTIQDLRDMALFGASEVKEANLNRYAVWVANLLIAYPNSTLIVENKSSGQSIMDTIAIQLMAVGINPYTRMFNRIVQEPDNHPSLHKEITMTKGRCTEQLYNQGKGKFGFMTSGKTREALYDIVLQRAAKTAGHLVVDARLSDQIRGLVSKNGRVDHPAGGHDDLVISWLLGHWFAMFAKNLEWYGIPKGYVQSHVSEEGATMTDEELKRVAQQAQIQKGIDIIKEQLSNCTSTMMRASIELRLSQLVRMLDTQEDYGLIQQRILEECRAKTKDRGNLRQAMAKHQTTQW